MDHKLSPMGKSDKPPPLDMFVTTHFKRRKDKNIYVRSTKHYATLKHIHVGVLSSKLHYAFYKI
jgi:hypothetical protein